MGRVDSRWLGSSLVGLLVGLAPVAVGNAQQQQSVPVAPTPAPLNAGVVTGTVARCVNGAEVPATNVAIGIQGDSSILARTNASGDFVIGLPPGTYTVTATADDGGASRPNVPVSLGNFLDIGILDIGGGLMGCGPDASAPAPAPASPPASAAPTPTPSAAAPATEPTATAAPTTSPEPAPSMAPDDTAPAQDQ